MKLIIYISSIVDMEQELRRNRLLEFKKRKILKGEKVTPIFELSSNSQEEIILNTLEKIKISLGEKRISLSDNMTKTIKYRPKFR